MSKPRRTHAEVMEGLRHSANRSRDTADEMAQMFEGCDDPLHPWKIMDAPYHSWVEFVDQVCRPLLDAEEAEDHAGIQAAMRLYRTACPHYIATCLVMAANRTQATT